MQQQFKTTTTTKNKNIMKTLDEIVKRTDYKNLNSALDERVTELAITIHKKRKSSKLKSLEIIK